MTQYLTIRTLSGPAYAGKDENNRHMWGFVVEAEAVAPVDDFESEIIKRLSDAGLATLITDRAEPPQPPGADTIRSGGTFPDSKKGPFIRVAKTGGSAPALERGPNLAVYENLSMSITARGQDSLETENRLAAIQRELWQITNTELLAA